MSDQQDDLRDLYEATHFLKRCNVRPFCTPERGMVLDLQGGTMQDWTRLWQALDRVGARINAAPAAPKPVKRVSLAETYDPEAVSRLLYPDAPKPAPPPPPRRHRETL